MTLADWILIAAVAAGLFCGAALVVRNPTFWIGLGIAIWGRIWPSIAAQIAHDMASPEVDARTKAETKLPGGPSKTGVTTGKTITQPAAPKRRT